MCFRVTKTCSYIVSSFFSMSPPLQIIIYLLVIILLSQLRFNFASNCSGDVDEDVFNVAEVLVHRNSETVRTALVSNCERFSALLYCAQRLL